MLPTLPRVSKNHKANVQLRRSRVIGSRLTLGYVTWRMRIGARTLRAFEIFGLTSLSVKRDGNGRRERGRARVTIKWKPEWGHESQSQESAEARLDEAGQDGTDDCPHFTQAVNDLMVPVISTMCQAERFFDDMASSRVIHSSSYAGIGNCSNLV